MQHTKKRLWGKRLADRNAEITRLWREEPYTKSELAQIFGLTHQRIGQIIGAVEKSYKKTCK